VQFVGSYYIGTKVSDTVRALGYAEVVNRYWNFGGRNSFIMSITSSSHGFLFQKT